MPNLTQYFTTIKRCKGNINFEEHFPHGNWILILSLQLVFSTAWSVITPSMYQFITTPREELQISEGSGRFWGGLGGSDTDYAWALTIPPLCELATVPVALWLTQKSPFTIPLLLGLLFLAASGVIYALALDIWMVLIARGLLGVCGGLCLPALHTYMGEMGSVMDNIREKQGKRPRKFTVYIAFSFILNGGYVVAFVLTSAIAQFHHVDPYRWPGWLMVAMAVLEGFGIVCCFQETRSLAILRSFKLPSVKLWSLKLKSSWKGQFLTYAFLIGCGYVSGQLYAVLFSLITPILSDQFGFNVEYTSHFLIGFSAAFCLSSFIQLSVKLAKMDNRKVLGLFLLLAAFGSLLLGDWQSIGHDPCSTTTANNITSHEYDYLTASGSASGDVLAASSGDNIVPGEVEALVEELLFSNESCLAESDPIHKCFWNPHSRVTGINCNTCVPACLSPRKSFCFYQFGLGVLTICIAAPLIFVLISVIASDIMPVRSQGAILTLVLSSGTVSRGVSPYWLVESYKLTGRHTYFAMAITAGCLLLLLVFLVVFYKNLAPQEEHHCTVSATSKSSSGDSVEDSLRTTAECGEDNTNHHDL